MRFDGVSPYSLSLVVLMAAMAAAAAGFGVENASVEPILSYGLFGH